MEALHQSGDRLNNRYHIVAPLSRGGICTTYQADDRVSKNQVAIKVLSLQQIKDWKAIELFEREAKVLKKLDHPAIPRYIDSFQTETDSDRRFYLVQQLIEGSSLDRLIQNGWKPGEVKIRQIATQLLEILCYLHRLQPPAIHRDIKPENILQRSDGQICLVDFGAVQDIYRQTVTYSGTVVGTFGYMPPEQFRGRAEPASDLYSLGATLVFLLTGRSPDRLPQKRMKIDFRSQVQVSDNLANWLEKLLEPAVEDRFQSAFQALEALHGEVSAVHSLTAAYQQPAESRVILYKKEQFLAVEVPPARWNLKAFFILLLNVAWYISLPVLLLLFLGTNLISAILGIEIGIAIALLQFVIIPVGVSWGLFAWLKAARGDRVYLEIDPYQFRLQRRFFGFKRRFQGNTATLSQVEATSKQFGPGTHPEMTHCILSAGSRKHQFNVFLTRSEREWLVAELSNFLAQIQS